MISLADSVSTGNFYRWTPKEKKQWTKLTKLCPTIGIEIETGQNLSRNVLRYLYTQGFVRTSCMSGIEITYLFDITQIDIFYRCAKKTVQVLGNQRVNTLGGLHINVGIVDPTYTYSDYPEFRDVGGIRQKLEQRVTYRIEYKDGAPFISHQQLIHQLVTKLELVHYIIDKKARLGQVENICL